MALKKLSNNQYIKIQLDGTFRIYKTPTEREHEKEVPTFNKIIAKYKAIIADLQRDRERIYYDPEFEELIKRWEMEFNRYLHAHQTGQKQVNLPLMSQYFPNISDSLPELVWEGRIGVLGNTLEEVYNYVKNCGYFGEVEDC